MRSEWLIMLTVPLAVALAIGWAADHYVMQTELTKAKREAAVWHCKFDLIDPIRAEAEVPLSDECKEVLFGKGRK